MRKEIQTEAYETQCADDLKQCETLLHELENIAGPKTVETVLEPMNDLAILLESSAHLAGLYSNVHPSKAIRETAKNHRQNISELSSRIYMSVPIYEALNQVPAPEDAITRRLLEEQLRDYRRGGVDQPEATRERIKELNEALTALGQTFNDTINTDVRFIELDSVDELAGLPEDYIASHPPRENGKIRITTNYPDYVPFMSYAQSDERRHELLLLYSNRGYPDNKEILERILATRYELATLLGYENFAAYLAEPRMIENQANIRAFIDKVADIARPRAEREYAEVLQRLQQIDPAAKKVDAWKAGFITEILKREKYEVDAKEVRSYFRFGHVRDGIFALTSKLFGVTYRDWDTEVWHEDVTAHEMLRDGQVIGRFYFDLHPREDKYKHGAHFSILSGIKDRQIPTSALVCNFPGGGGDIDALMEHSQVVTFLHEFGHLQHHLFGGQHHWSYFSGIATQHDFVEAPSQMLEEWIWSREALDLISANKAGEPIPDALLAKMEAAKEFGGGLRVAGQMYLSAMSLGCYDRDPAGLDLEQTMLDLKKKYSIYEHVPGTHGYANFGHLFGYSAAYYTYMWSLVISKDLFSRFEAEGMMNTTVAREYLDAILAPGGSKDAADLVADFLGRPYSFEPFEKWLNGGTANP